MVPLLVSSLFGYEVMISELMGFDKLLNVIIYQCKQQLKYLTSLYQLL
jgi:hypothetical protein